MRNKHYASREALAVKTDYVESKLDESIRSLKEANAQLERRHAEAMDKLDRRHVEAMAKSEARLAADREASEARLKADREEFNMRFSEERKEWKSTKRWLYLNFGGVIALIVTVVLALLNGSIPN